MKILPDYMLDLRGVIIPFALLKISQKFHEIKVSETIEILLNDPDTKRDVFKILPPFSYKLIELNNEGTFCRIRLKKRAENRYQDNFP